MKATVAFVLLAVSLMGCGEGPEKFAGGGSDQPNKVQAGRVLTDSGLPAAGVQVVSWSGEWDPVYSNVSGKPVDSSVTDSKGNWSLRVPDAPEWYVTAKSPGYRAVALPGQTEIRLTEEARLYATVSRPHGLFIESIWIGGTGQSLPVRWFNDSYGDIVASVLPGTARIWAKVSWKGGFDTLLLAEKTFDKGDNSKLELYPDTANTLLLSAESNPIRSALRGLDYDVRDLEAGKWFATTDTDWGGNSSLEPATFPKSNTAVKTSPAGRYFSWKMKLGNPLEISSGKILYPWVGVGVRLSRRDLDWSGIKTIQLRVRGGTANSKIWVQLNSSEPATEIDRVEGVDQFGYLLDLPSSGMSTIDIPITAFASVNGTKGDTLKNKWETIKHSIRGITFFAGSPNVTFELQEARAIGNRLKNW